MLDVIEICVIDQKEGVKIERGKKYMLGASVSGLPRRAGGADVEDGKARGRALLVCLIG